MQTAEEYPMEENKKRNRADVFTSTGLSIEGSEDEGIDGFTEGELLTMLLDAIAIARCDACGEYAAVEPDARDYDCHACDAEHSVTSPLVKLGLI